MFGFFKICKQEVPVFTFRFSVEALRCSVRRDPDSHLSPRHGGMWLQTYKYVPNTVDLPPLHPTPTTLTPPFPSLLWLSFDSPPPFYSHCATFSLPPPYPSSPLLLSPSLSDLSQSAHTIFLQTILLPPLLLLTPSSAPPLPPGGRVHFAGSGGDYWVG